MPFWAPMMQSNLMWIHNGYYSESNMYKGIKCWSLALDLQGNDMVLTLTNNWYKDMYMLNNLRQQTSSNVAEYWYTLYKIVYRANQILDLMPENPSNAALIYQAQALTYRALGYYYLMNLYQVDYMHGGKDKPGVPLHLTVGGSHGPHSLDRSILNHHCRPAECDQDLRGAGLRSHVFDGGH